jgi:orotate phosphoribosyltransferase
MKLSDFDPEPIAVRPPQSFYLWCCDCHLRHHVIVDIVSKTDEELKKLDIVVGIAMIRDSVATELSRKSEGVVVYKRKRRKKNGTVKQKQADVSKKD